MASRTTLVILVVLLVASMTAAGFQSPTDAKSVSCASFASRAAAQAALAASPTVAAILDADRDGRACEDIFDPEPGDGEGGAAEQLTTRPVADASTRTRPSRTSLLPGDTSQPNVSRLKLSLIEAAADIDAFWIEAYDDPGTIYSSPDVRTFQQSRETECGPAETGIGPGYCSLDQTIYIDVPIIRQVDMFHDPFVMRTILAHEWGHHIQYLSGYQSATFPDQRGEVYSLQLELDADCLAGVWAHHAKEVGEATEEDLLNAMNMAYMIGDDPGGSLLAPDAHGTGQMRLGAFTIGLNSGKPRLCEREILKLM